MVGIRVTSSVPEAGLIGRRKTRGTSDQLPRPSIIIMIEFIASPRKTNPWVSTNIEKPTAHFTVCQIAQIHVFILRGRREGGLGSSEDSYSLYRLRTRLPK